MTEDRDMAFGPAMLSGLEKKLASRSPRHLTEPEGFTRAGVLVPLMVHPDGVRLALMRRTEAGGPHGGQISFPGGRPEPSDESVAATALREACEEFGLKPEAVTVLGRLDDELTVTGYVVTPFAGRIRGPFPYEPDPAEVAEIFEVPVEFFLDPRNEQEATPVKFKGRNYTLYQYDFEGRIIWGLTARIIHVFMKLLREIIDGGEDRDERMG